MPRARRPMSPQTFHTLVGLGVTLTLATALWFLFGTAFTWYVVLAAWLGACNLTAFGYYGFDKARARAQGRRVPERVLHLLALAGGSIGAWTAMHLFRHKTIKGPFRAVFWCVVGLQLAVLLWIVWLVWPRGA